MKKFPFDDLEIYQMMDRLDRQMIPLRARQMHLTEAERVTQRAIMAAAATGAALAEFSDSIESFRLGMLAMSDAIDNMMENVRRSVMQWGAQAIVSFEDSVDLKVVDPDSGKTIIEGTALKYNEVDANNQLIRPGAFDLNSKIQYAEWKHEIEKIGFDLFADEHADPDEMRKQDFIDRVWDRIYYNRDHGRIIDEIIWFALYYLSNIVFYNLPIWLFADRKLARARDWTIGRFRGWLHRRGWIESPSLRIFGSDKDG